MIKIVCPIPLGVAMYQVMSDDMTLVREFASSQSDPAFARLVERHIDLVHSAALRQAGDAHLAEEITQAVFIILAPKAASLGPDTILSAWLYRTARHAAADALKARRRRQAREQEAHMQSLLNEPTPEAWQQLAPVLDDAMSELGENDRAALVLRFFENKSAREIAAALRLEEATAQKRVTRALEKLRAILSKRGVTLTTVILAATISSHSVSAAPLGLTATVTAASAQGALLSASTLSIINATLKLMAWSKIKTTILAGAFVLLAAGTATFFLFQDKLEARPAPIPATPAVALNPPGPLDLTAYYTTPLVQFDNITSFPAWKTVPRGMQTFVNVPLDIRGMICLWGEGNATQLKIVFPEAVRDIKLGQKFETLYVYHACFFKSPAGTPVCEVVFRYADGASTTNQMFYGEDFIDWVTNGGRSIAGPTAARSTLAWVGGSFSTNKNQPLRICMTAVENTRPSLEVKSIDLYSSKSKTAPCIMALTTGKSGMVKPMDAK